jgi:hypothetical protein
LFEVWTFLLQAVHFRLGCPHLVRFFRTVERPTNRTWGAYRVVDGCDRERISESVEELAKHIKIMTSDPDDPSFRPQDLPVLM